MRNRERDSGQGLMEADHFSPQSNFDMSHFLTTKYGIFNQNIYGLLLLFIIACRSTCQAAGFQATDSFNYNINNNNKKKQTLRPLRVRIFVTSSSSLLPLSRGAAGIHLR